MDEQAVIDRLDALIDKVRAEMPIMGKAANKAYQFAEVLYMTDAELHEFHYLRSLLPSGYWDRQSAIIRLCAKHPNLVYLLS